MMKKVFIIIVLLSPYIAYADGNRVNYMFGGVSYPHFILNGEVNQSYVSQTEVVTSGTSSIVTNPDSYYKSQDVWFNQPNQNYAYQVDAGIGWGDLYSNTRREMFVFYGQFDMYNSFDISERGDKMTLNSQQAYFGFGYNLYYDFNQLKYFNTWENHFIPYIMFGVGLKYAFTDNKVYSDANPDFLFKNNFNRNFLISGTLGTGFTVDVSEKISVDLGVRITRDQDISYYSATGVQISDISTDTRKYEQFTVDLQLHPWSVAGLVHLMYKF